MAVFFWCSELRSLLAVGSKKKQAVFFQCSPAFSGLRLKKSSPVFFIRRLRL
jgi:hypothetical protein